METYKISYVIDGVTYFFIGNFQIPKNDPKSTYVFLSAIDNDKERRLLDGKVTEWNCELLQPESHS
ncbi:hypothetical protein [Bacteroides fragilis]|uniref:hypothetical protein n=1 Tax=Bacteroides fragilis TaxID=817 RepID=UPI002811AB8B|nr:hypothetical protein [Bacteroides fragilis]WMI95622.1 hypothetical protein BFGS084_03054 [Bacteroides fragilis]